VPLVPRKAETGCVAAQGRGFGYTDIWYEDALNNSVSFTLPSGQTIRLITAPYFLGTKMEAFRRRGNNSNAAI